MLAYDLLLIIREWGLMHADVWRLPSRQYL